MPTNLYQARPSTLQLEARTGKVGLEDAVYVNTSDSLDVLVVSSTGGNPGSSNPPAQGIQIFIDMRMLTVNSGLIYQTFSINPTNDYVTNHYQIKLPEGFILNANAYTSGIIQQTQTGVGSNTTLPIVGQAWVCLTVVNSNNPSLYTGTFLAQGYVTNCQRINYPIPQTVSYPDGVPFVRQLFPAVGQGVTYTVPLHAINEITGCSFIFQTSASVGQRQVYLQFFGNNGTTNPPVLTAPITTNQGNNATIVYLYACGYPYLAQAGNEQYAPLPIRLRLCYGDSVVVTVTNTQAGDQISRFSIWGNEWLVP